MFQCNEHSFTADGRLPSQHVAAHQAVHAEISWGALAKALLPANSALSNGEYLDEPPGEMIDSDLEVIRGSRVRFRLFSEGRAVAGLVVSDGVVETLYVARDRRREGLGTQLFERAKDWLGGLEHSDVLTETELLFRRSFPDGSLGQPGESRPAPPGEDDGPGHR